MATQSLKKTRCALSQSCDNKTTVRGEVTQSLKNTVVRFTVVALSADDDNREICDNKIETFVYGHTTES